MVFDIGNTIKSRRKQLKITQPQLAELAEISVNTLTKLERGEGNTSLKIIYKVTDVLGMELKLEVRKNI